MKKVIHNPYSKFKGWLRENDLTYKDVAEFLGLSVVTVTAKINGQSDFLLSEIGALQKCYNIDSSIFFNDDVA